MSANDPERTFARADICDQLLLRIRQAQGRSILDTEFGSSQYVTPKIAINNANTIERPTVNSKKSGIKMLYTNANSVFPALGL